MRRTGLALLFALLAAAAAAAAPIYKTTDEQGNVVYTDAPGERPAELVELPDITVFPAPEAPPPASTTAGTEGDAPDEAEPVSFSVELLQPAQEATVRSNTGDLEVLARVDRALREGDRFEVLVDGEVRARNAGGSFALTGVVRGAHDVSVRIVDEDGRVVGSSPTHTFFMHQRSRLHP